MLGSVAIYVGITATYRIPVDPLVPVVRTNEKLERFVTLTWDRTRRAADGLIGMPDRSVSCGQRGSK
jgi:hypothetical protein